MAPHLSFAATCEDYNSDNGETVPDTRKQANVSAKRSHPSDLGKPSIIRTGGRDAASDSGYSSHTAATLGSADLPVPPPPLPPSVQHPRSSMEISSASSSTGDGAWVTSKTKSDSGSSTAKRRSANVARPAIRSDARSQSKSSSSGTAPAAVPASPIGSSRPSRSESQARRTRQQSRSEEECNNPSCTCQRDRRRAPSSPGSRPSVATLPPYAAMPRPQPSPSSAPYYGPPSPRTQRYPAGVAPMVVEASQPLRRPGPMSRARPISYHAGMSREALWASGTGFGAFADPRGPPLSFSAYANPPQPPHMVYHQMNMNPAHLSYQSLHPGQDRPPMPESTRGMPAPLPSLNYSTRRPISSYAPPQIHYEPPTPGFPPPHTNMNSNPSTGQPRIRQIFSPPPFMARPVSTFEDSYSTSSFESSEPDEDVRDDRRRMPPPSGPVRRRRPEIRHAATVAHPERATAREIKLHPSTRTHYNDNVRSNPASGSTSRRPSLVHNRTKSKTYTEPGATTMVESSTSRRRMSYRAHEQRSNDIDAARKASEAYQADVRARASSSRRRRETEATSNSRDGGRSVNRRSIVIDGHDADLTIPLTEEALRKTKRSSRLETLSVATSETGSGQSKAGSSHNGDNGNKTSNARMVIDGRTLSGGTSSNKTPGTSGEDAGDGSTSPVTESIYMQYKGLNVEIQGNMEGKTLSWRQQEDGKPQLVLGDIGENERPCRHSGTQEQDNLQDRGGYRERVKEPSHRTQSRSRAAARGAEDYDDDERERRARRRRSSNRTEPHSRPTNIGFSDRRAPAVVSNSTKPSSATRRGSLHRGQTYHDDNDGAREYHSPLRAKPVRYPSTRSSQKRAVPIVHNRQSGDRLASRSRSPHRNRSRYRSQSGRSVVSATSKMTSKMSKLTMKRNRQYVDAAEVSSDDEDTARENQAPSSSSSLATTYLYNGREGGAGGAAAAAAANALKGNRDGQRWSTIVSSGSDVGSIGVNMGSIPTATAGRSSSGRNAGFVGRMKSKFEEHKAKQLRGGSVRGGLGMGGSPSVSRSAMDSAVFDDDDDDDEDDDDDDDEDDDDDTDEDDNEGNRRMYDAVQDWI